MSLANYAPNPGRSTPSPVEVVVEADDIARSYVIGRGPFTAKATLRAVAGASFRLMAGRTLAVVGESGSGKSTLARMVAMIEPSSSGSLIIDGVNIATATQKQIKALRPAVQIVFQNPYGSLNPRQRIGVTLEEPLVINRPEMNAAARREEALAMMQRVGLRSEHYERYPHMFSGGQRQRIAIARALMLRPKILILDEPVSALDVSVRAQVLNILTRLKDEFGLAYLFISHDLSVVRHMADELMVVYLGRPVEFGSSELIFANPRHPYTRALLSATPVADPRRVRERIKLQGETPSPINPPSGCPFHPRCPIAFEPCSVQRPPLEVKGGVAVACHAVNEHGVTRPPVHVAEEVEDRSQFEPPTNLRIVAKPK